MGSTSQALMTYLLSFEPNPAHFVLKRDARLERVCAVVTKFAKIVCTRLSISALCAARAA